MMRDVRVAVDARYLSEPFGSMTVYCTNLLRALVEMDLGARPVALIPRELHASAQAVREELADAVQWVTPERNPFDAGRTTAAELRWVHRVVPSLLAERVPDADVLIVTYHHPPARTPGVRRLTIVHDLCGLGVGFPRTKKAYWRHYLRLRAAAHLADLILPISQATRDAMLSRFPASSERMGPVVYNGVSRRPVDERTLAETLAVHGLQRRSYVVAFATWQARKNFSATLAAVSELRRRGRPLRLVGIAPHGERDTIVERCRAAGQEDAIILSGVTDEELDALYGGAVALVWPSLCEGFGYPVVEAMAQGCPPLVGPDGPGAELIVGALAPLPSLSSTAIAAGIDHLRQLDAAALEDLQRSLQARAARFTNSAYRDQLFDVLRQLAASER